MKTALLIMLLLAGSLFGQEPVSTNKATAGKNVLAIYLVADMVSRDSLLAGTATPDGLKLYERPILSDQDFVAWNVTNHTFTITPAAAMRVGVECADRTRPFVLVAEGVPIYVGAFWTLASSTSCSVPVIIADLAVVRCFKGLDNIPNDVCKMMGRCDPGTLDRLMALAKTTPTTNVTLRIDLGYAYFASSDVQESNKRRSDPRIAAAVQTLFARRKE